MLLYHFNKENLSYDKCEIKEHSEQELSRIFVEKIPVVFTTYKDCQFGEKVVAVTLKSFIQNIWNKSGAVPSITLGGHTLFVEKLQEENLVIKVRHEGARELDKFYLIGKYFTPTHDDSFSFVKQVFPKKITTIVYE